MKYVNLINSVLLCGVMITGIDTTVAQAAAQGQAGRVADTYFFQHWAASNTISAALFGKDNVWDSSYKGLEGWKKAHHLPITIGAESWFHINNGGPVGSGYGEPGLSGTYYWYLKGDPRWTFNQNNFIQAIGYHGELRFRDSSDKFRSWFSDSRRHVWFYQNYGYVDTPVGRFKAGQIWKRFGLDWDGTWWGDAQYFDGLKLDTAYGFSWENTWHPAKRFKLKSYAQYFISEAGVNGSIAGGTPQSVPGSHERNIGVIRLVPTWQLSKDSSLAIGVSGLAGQIRNTSSSLGGDTSQLAYAVDGTYTWRHFKVFGEVDQSFGRLSPIRYVSGGPSNRITDTEIGASYQYGPVTFRMDWSAGFDANPSGRQYIWIPGVTVALAKNVTMYAEYVNWRSIDHGGNSSQLENGFQLAFDWHF